MIKKLNKIKNIKNFYKNYETKYKILLIFCSIVSGK